LQELQDLLV
jgi:hypothetical protein